MNDFLVFGGFLVFWFVLNRWFFCVLWYPNLHERSLFATGSEAADQPSEQTGECRPATSLTQASRLKRVHTRKRAADPLNELELGDRLDHSAAMLSGGQQQRVAVARALSVVVRAFFFKDQYPPGAVVAIRFGNVQGYM